MTVKINENYLLLKSNYIFSEINQRVEKYQKDNPDSDIIEWGIGDVTRLYPSIVKNSKSSDEIVKTTHFGLRSKKVMIRLMKKSNIL